MIDMTDIRVSNSKLKTYRRCPKRYEYKYMRKLDPRRRSVQLERGSWIHTLLETYYDGEDWEAKHKELSKVFYNEDEETREDLGDLPAECRRIMLSYIRTYEAVDKHFVVVDSELNEYVDLGNGITLQIIVDLIVEDRRTHRLWAWDHKTRKSFEVADNMLLDPQLTLYFGGLERMGYTNMGGVLYNEIRTKAPTVPKQIKTGGLSKAVAIDTDVYTYMSEIRRLGLDPDEYSGILRHLAANERERFFRRVQLPKDPPMVKQMMRETVQTAGEIIVAERKERFPRTFIPTDCRWSCDYKNLCIAELHGADTESLIKMEFRRRNRMD